MTFDGIHRSDHVLCRVSGVIHFDLDRSCKIRSMIVLHVSCHLGLPHGDRLCLKASTGPLVRTFAVLGNQHSEAVCLCWGLGSVTFMLLSRM